MLEDSSGGGAFLNGGVTFAAFRPLRTIPARVICLLGMNDGVLPRQMSPSGFDLMASFPRQGDRQARAEDRYLMLESVCAAQDVFYVSYVGRSIRDDSQLPSSILVAELLDCVSRMTPDFKVLEHPLQPFSSRYFSLSNTQLFSYAERYAIASRAALHTNARAPFVGQPLPPPDGQWCHVDIDELLRFYEHPARYFLRERLGVTLVDEEDSHPDHEPFELDGLENWHLKQLLLNAMEQGLSIEETERVARATGQLPHGRLGSSLLMKQSAVIAEFHARKQSFLADIELSQLEVDIPVSVNDLSFKISGQLSGVTANGLITWRLSQLRSKHKLGLWIQHLLLCVLQPVHVLRQSWLIAEDDTLHFGPLSALEAENHLRDLLALYWEGLQSPLPLFAQCSLLLAEDANASKVMSAWDGQWSTVRDADDPVNALVFAELSPMSPMVIALAKRVYEPLMHALKAEA
jgi:exodeoxyribonuclease V gamma subunit